MNTDWDIAYKNRHRYPLETGEGLRSHYTPPDSTDSGIGLVMRFCLGLVIVFLAGFIFRDGL